MFVIPTTTGASTANKIAEVSIVIFFILFMHLHYLGTVFIAPLLGALPEEMFRPRKWRAYWGNGGSRVSVG